MKIYVTIVACLTVLALAGLARASNDLSINRHNILSNEVNKEAYFISFPELCQKIAFFLDWGLLLLSPRLVLIVR